MWRVLTLTGVLGYTEIQGKYMRATGEGWTLSKYYILICLSQADVETHPLLTTLDMAVAFLYLVEGQCW